MFTRLTFLSFLALAVAACGDDGAQLDRRTWDVVAGPTTCTVADTGATSNEDPGTLRLVELQADGAAVLTFNDGATIPGAWLDVPGDPDRPANDPARLHSIQISVPDYEHGGPRGRSAACPSGRRPATCAWCGPSGRPPPAAPPP